MTKPEIKIESHIPLPASRRGPRKSKYPFAGLAVGQSFFVVDANSNAVHSSVSRFVNGNGEGKKFTVRTTTEFTKESPTVQVPGVRVWRTQ